MGDRFGVVSADLWSMRDEIGQVLGREPVRLGARGACEVVGWADPRGRTARRLARLLGVPYRAISVGPFCGIRPGDRPLSLVLGQPEQTGELDVARTLEQWRRLRLSWRNDGRDRLPAGLAGQRIVLVIATRADRSSAADAIRRALDESPGCRPIVVADSREPPDLAAQIAAGHPEAAAVEGTNPHALFAAAERVYAPPGDLRREAGLAGCRVMPFGKSGADGIEGAALFKRVYLAEPVYFDPWSRKPASFEHVADRLAWLRNRFLDNDRPSICIGVSRWKRCQVARILDGPDGQPVFATHMTRAVGKAASRDGRIVAWETRMPAGLDRACAAAGVPLVRMEDGFLRSVGLGAAFRPGASAVLDASGIYYDPRRENDLERILATATFSPDLLARARALRAKVVALRLSKYNVGGAAQLDALPQGRRIVLVPGQVEDDASILFGSPWIRGNLDLLAAARRHNPDAYLIFKPHPDVAAGLRRGKLTDAQALRHADQVVADVAIADLLDRVDALETMTSLAGFEALLRGKHVAVHGQPFYAGWGLTLDRHPPPRRTRRLDLDELVAGALILYPRYIDLRSGLRCPPEILVARLAEERDAVRGAPALPAAARAAYIRARYMLLGPLALLLRRMYGAVKAAPPRDATDETR